MQFNRKWYVQWRVQANRISIMYVVDYVGYRSEAHCRGKAKFSLNGIDLYSNLVLHLWL